MRSRIWILSIGAAAACFFTSVTVAQTPALPADQGAVTPAPVRRALPADQGAVTPAPVRRALPADIFQPPPVPGFMLRAPEKPLTHEEMLREAEEAAARVRQPLQPQRTTTPDAASPAQLQNSVK